VVITLANGTRTTRQVAITPQLTFDDVLRLIARGRESEFELQSEEGSVLAGVVSSVFEGQQTEARVVLSKIVQLEL
jgi:hypothetical protein